MCLAACHEPTCVLAALWSPGQQCPRPRDRHGSYADPKRAQAFLEAVAPVGGERSGSCHRATWNCKAKGILQCFGVLEQRQQEAVAPE